MFLAMAIKIRKQNGAVPTDFILIISVKSSFYEDMVVNLFVPSDCKMSVLNYSKWDKIEISDDEDDTHPNIHTPSLFKWRHDVSFH